MKKMLTVLALITGLCFFLHQNVLAGSPPTDAPGSAATGMHTLDEIYTLLEKNKDKLDEIYNAYSRTPDEVCSGKTFIGFRGDGTIGEMTGNCVDRFTDKGDGTVRDCRTGLIWLKNANCYGVKTWADAKTAAQELNDGECGLTDGSEAGDWHLATKEELQGIGTDPPVTWESAFPSVTWTIPGEPFDNVPSNDYWSSTEYNTIYARRLHMVHGDVTIDYKDNGHYVWPVRSGN
jgi:hypothetical protein